MVKSFPNTEAYVILFDPGAGGFFIKNLLSSLYRNEEFSPSSLGDMHDKNFDSNITKESLEKYKYHSATHFLGDRLLVLDPIDENKPIFMTSHLDTLAYKTYFKKFPKGKIVFISSDTQDQARINVNIFFKSIIFSGQKITDSIENQLKWKTYSRLFPFLKEQRSMLNCTSEEYLYMFKKLEEQALEIINAKKQKRLRNNFPINLWNSDYISSLKISNSQYIEIPYSKIIKDKQHTIENLCSFTNQPCNESVVKSYDRYLNAQTELLSKYAPWILEDPNLT